MISEIILIPELHSDAAPTEPPASEKRRDAKEIGGREGLDPTRYGDWEKNGRCIDF